MTLAVFTHEIFESHKNSGFVVKFAIASDVAAEISQDHIKSQFDEKDFRGTFYIHRTFKTFEDIKLESNHFTVPWNWENDIIAFIYDISNYDKPYAVFVNNKFIELNKVSEAQRINYASYSGMYVESISPLWVREF